MLSTQVSYISTYCSLCGRVSLCAIVESSALEDEGVCEVEMEMMMMMVGLHGCFILLSQFLLYSLMAVETNEHLKHSVLLFGGISL